MDSQSRRIQRREFKDYQPLFMLISSLDIVEEVTRRQFMCIHGPVWQRYNDATKGAKNRRITVLFLGDENNCFDELLLVTCSFVRRRQHRSVSLWSDHPLAHGLDEAAVRHVCHDLSGRSVLTWQSLQPWLRPDGASLPRHKGLMEATPCLGAQA